MKYKNDWPASRKRFEYLWNREIVDRCCISVTSPKENREVEYQKLKSLPRLYGWGNAEEIVKRHRGLFEVTYFGGESFPGIWLNMGTSGHAGFFQGAKYSVNDETVWFDPILLKDAYESLIFDEGSDLYRMTLDHAKYYISDSQGDYFVSMPDTSGNLDALAHLRGNVNLLMDLAVNSESVHNALMTIEKVWERIISEVYELVRKNNDNGSMIYWLKSWAPGLHSQLQADISVMISPECYQEYIVPELVTQSEFLEFPLYHLDGAEQVRHLEHLLSVDKIKMIQWTSVAGQPSPLKFIDSLRKIQDSNKALLLRLNDITLIEPLLENLSAKGLYFVVEAESEGQAKDVLRMVEKLTHD